VVTLDKREGFRRATSLIAERRADAAVPLLWALIDRTYLVEDEPKRYLSALAECYAQLGNARAEATIHLYLGDARRAAQRSRDVPVDLARAAVATKRPLDAARSFEHAGLIAHAALQLEQAEDFRGARALWERLAVDARLRDEPYTLGLVAFNLARACASVDDAAAARRATVQSIHLLEAAADSFEAEGLRERAFDCYQVLLGLGRAGAFENLAEGYLNCIRILASDNLKYYVLQYYEDFQEQATERGELHAAATLFREAADFCRRHRLEYERYYRRGAGETHLLAAERSLAEHGAVQIAENAFMAAIEAFNDVGYYTRVREVYDRLARLPLAEKRRDRYRRLSDRLGAIPDDTEEFRRLPEYLRVDMAYPQIWRDDVIEWENRGDPAETMAEILAAPTRSELSRRRALLCRLFALGEGTFDPSGEGQVGAANHVGLATHLGRVELYEALAPLEHLYRSESAEVRAAVLRAVRQLFFKRSFILVARGLADPDSRVRVEAREAVSALHFAHAFDRLARIFRTSADPEVRRAALGAIAKIETLDAVELLIEVLRHGDPSERALAQRHLSQSQFGELEPVLRRAASYESGPAAAALQQILKGTKRGTATGEFST
jgi:hypothetical protein